jgi:lysophospholipase L1-like esterase
MRALRLLSLFMLLTGAVPAWADGQWLASWSTSQQLPEPRNALPPENLQDATLRQIVRLSVGGPAIRVRISNAFGTTPLHVLAVHVARAPSTSSGRIDPASDRAITFNQRADVLIPAGTDYISDALQYPVQAAMDLAITLRLEDQPGQQTGHPGSRATSYFAKGVAPDVPELNGAQPIDHWYFLAGIDVIAKGEAVVVLGDSITDGRGSTTNGNDRWTDFLAARLRKGVPRRAIAVLNAGLGGNRLLNDGLGPNALARFDRDVLAPTGVRYLIVLEGINDIGTLTQNAPASEAQHDELVHRMIGAYQQIVTRARAHGIKVIGCTILPFMGTENYHPNADNERDRQRVNAWIRARGNFDAVVDFDKALADPARPEWLNPKYDSGDHLHPSPAGFSAMAEAVPLDLFKPPRR